jgi:hypothetical protein
MELVYPFSYGVITFSLEGGKKGQHDAIFAQLATMAAAKLPDFGAQLRKFGTPEGNVVVSREERLRYNIHLKVTAGCTRQVPDDTFEGLLHDMIRDLPYDTSMCL